MVACLYNEPQFRFRAGQQQLNLSGPYYPPNGSKMFSHLTDLIDRNDLKQLTIDACIVRLDRSSLSGLLGFLDMLNNRKIKTRFRWLYFADSSAGNLISPEMFHQMPLVECEMVAINPQACSLCKGC